MDRVPSHSGPRARARLVALIGLSCAQLFVAPTPALAAAVAPAEDPALTRAQDLYEKGRGKFETADFAAAVELWTEAYTALPADTAYSEVKVLLLYNIATAREKAFEIDGELSQLRQAEVLLKSFEDNIPALYEDPKVREEELTRVRERRQTIAAKIAEAEAARAAEESEPAPEEPEEPVEEPAPPPSQEEVDAPEDDRAGKALVATGAGLTVLGGVGLGIMVGGLVMGSGANDIADLDTTDAAGRGDQFATGRLGNTLAIVGGVAGGVFVATGVALIVVGKLRKGKGKATALAPAIGPGVLGLQLTGRF
ncbi:MAG: hypothetical protein R3A51_02620 [Nannocystaceae bacterium]|nr:hypothetical protein [Myxococcales bacterium]